MFWKYNTTPSPQIEAVLYKKDVTLQELMDLEEIISECKVQNKKLIDFLARPEIMEELVTLTTVEPSSDIDEQIRFKYPNIACELLTCDVPTLNERLAGDEALLSKLYSFIDSEPPLNPLLASFFSRTMGVLIAKRCELNWLSYQFTCLQVLEFLKAKDNFISLLLKHLGTSAIMDLTLKLMTQVEGVEMRLNILNWLDSQRIIQSLVALLDPKVDSERHFNVAQLLCDFIKTARDSLRNGNNTERSDPLLNTIESPETVTLLLDQMLGDEKCETSIVGGIQVLLTLLEVNKTCIPIYDSVNQYSNSNSYDEVSDQEQRQIVVLNVTAAILTRLSDIHNILLDPPKKTPVQTSVGLLEPPLGNTRLQVVRLLACLYASGNPEFMQETMSLGTVNVLLDLFFKYNWNNFLHFQVEQCIASAFRAHVPTEREGENALYTHLIVNCRLIERVLEAWNANELQQAQSKGVRQGYMGSLINIANNIVNLHTSSALGEFIKENVSTDTNEAWDVFQEGALAETNKTQQILLGGVHPTNRNEDSDDYREIPYSQASITHQGVYNDYQVQQMTPPIIENYGISGDDYNDLDDPLPDIDRRPEMNFDLSESNLSQQREIFKQICSQNVNTLGGEIFEDLQFPFQSVGEKPGDNYSSDSDKEGDDNSPTDDPLMDIDQNQIFKITAWRTPLGSNSEMGITPLASEDPWGSSNTFELVGTDMCAQSWADFGSFDVFNSPFPQATTESTDKNEKPIVQTVDNIITGEEISAPMSSVDLTENLAQKVDALKKEIEILKQDNSNVVVVNEEPDEQSEKEQNVVVNEEITSAVIETEQPSISSSTPSEEGDNVPPASV